MSSSEAHFAAPTRFFAALLATAALALLLLAATLLIVDPLGNGNGNPLCPAGAKDTNARAAKALVLSRLHPRAIVLGTSRVMIGFDRAALTELGGEDTVNLGVSNGHFSDYRILAEGALAGGRLRTAYFGVDFASLRDPIVPQPAPSPPASRYAQWRLAYASMDSLHGLITALPNCRPRIRKEGSPVSASWPGLRGPEELASSKEQVRRRFLRRKAWLDMRGTGHFDERLDEFSHLIDRLQANGVEVVLFSAPNRKELLDAVDDAGLRSYLSLWHTKMKRFASNKGVRFVDFSSGPENAALGLPACPSGGNGCHYLDLTHYKPEVARAMVPMLRGAPEPATLPR